jgi:hypothetical protein
VQDLAVSVAQRDKISGLGSTKDASEGDEQEFRLQELVWRRLVLEEARQQVRRIRWVLGLQSHLSSGCGVTFTFLCVAFIVKFL